MHDSTGTKVIVTWEKPTIIGKIYRIDIFDIVTAEGDVYSDMMIRFGGAGDWVNDNHLV